MKACRPGPRLPSQPTRGFYNNFGPFVAACARARTRGTRLDADDIAQEVAIKLLALVEAGRFQGEAPGKVRGFVRRTTCNLVIDKLRQPHYRAMQRACTDEMVFDRIDGEGLDPERQARARRTLDIIYAALDESSEVDRQTFDVLFVQGCNARQGAERLGINHGAMRMRKSGLVKRLRAACPEGAAF